LPSRFVLLNQIARINKVPFHAPTLAVVDDGGGICGRMVESTPQRRIHAPKSPHDRPAVAGMRQFAFFATSLAGIPKSRHPVLPVG